jgi:hypothetical protein
MSTPQTTTKAMCRSGCTTKNGAHAFNRERWQPAAYPYYRHDTHHSEFTPRYDSITKARSRSLRVVPASQSRRRFTAAAKPLRLSRPHSTCNDVVDNGGTPKLPKKVPLWLEAERRHCSTGVTGAVANVWEASIAGQLSGTSFLKGDVQRCRELPAQLKQVLAGRLGACGASWALRLPSC